MSPDEKVAAEIHILERQLEESKQNCKELRYVMGDIIEKWDAFYSALPDGEYGGLGELRGLLNLVRKNFAARPIRSGNS